MKKTIGILVGVAGLILAPLCFREARAQYSPPSGVTYLSASGTLSSVTLLAMTNTASVSIVAAQGAGTIIVPDSLVLKLHYGGTAYNASTLRLTYGAPTSATTIGQACTNLLSTTADSDCLSPVNGSTVQPSATSENVALSLSASTSSVTTGNGTVTWNLRYHVVTP